MKLNTFQFITNEHLEFIIECHHKEASSYWTLSGSTPTMNLAQTFTAKMIAPINEGFLRDGDYSIIPIVQDSEDFIVWMTTIASQDIEKDPRALGELIYSIVKQPHVQDLNNICGINKCIKDIENEIILLSICHEEYFEHHVRNCISMFLEWAC